MSKTNGNIEGLLKNMKIAQNKKEALFYHSVTGKPRNPTDDEIDYEVSKDQEEAQPFNSWNNLWRRDIGNISNNVKEFLKSPSDMNRRAIYELLLVLYDMGKLTKSQLAEYLDYLISLKII
jgi:hypothetical protein